MLSRIYDKIIDMVVSTKKIAFPFTFLSVGLVCSEMKFKQATYLRQKWPDSIGNFGTMTSQDKKILHS